MWLEQYLRGGHVHVWTEMTGTDVILLGSRDADDARAVARETMRRARRNVERLVELLPGIGYEFEPREWSPVFTPPEPDIADRLAELEREVGPIPLSLRAWYEEVGQVDLVGRHPGWDYELTDPLVVDAPIDHVLSEFEDRGTEGAGDRFLIGLAPDFWHKADVSGGAPYSLEVPNRGVDGLLLYEPHQTTFVNHLRIAFRWGGFPGWDRSPLDGSASPPPGPPPAVLAEIAAALEPI